MASLSESLILLGNSVRQIRPRVNSFDSALFAFSNADYDATLHHLTRDESVRALLLRARVLIRLGQFGRSVDELQSLNVEELRSCDGAEAMTLMSLAHVGLRTGDSITEHLATARMLSLLSGSVVHEADVEFATALHYYTGGHAENASNALYRLLDLGSAGSPWIKIEKKTVQSLEEIRARAYDLLGHIAAREYRFLDQASFIYLAFGELDKTVGCDPYVESKLLGNLAVIAADRDVEGVYECVRSRVATTKFPGACQVLEFEIRRNLGRCASMHGNHIGALRELRRSAEIAPSRASKIKALLDRSSLALELNEFVFANEELDFALDLTRQVDWSTASSTEIVALLAMSQNLANRNPVEARRFFNRFGEYKKRLDPFHDNAIDLGFAGRESQADALISRAEGNVDRAVRLNRDAFNSFKRVEYIGRAAIVALELFEITGERSYIEYAAAYSRNLPQSHLARRVNGHLNASMHTA